MLTREQKIKITTLIKGELDKAERNWKVVGKEFVEKTEAHSVNMAEAIDSNIPEHPKVNDGIPDVDEFIALVADMRDSSKHLLCEISEKKAKVSTLQRVYYETSALLPAMAKTIEFENGSVTEYLGDGLLALFHVSQLDKSKGIYAAHKAAKNIINETRGLLNLELARRYCLPAIDIGVGLSMSKAMVTLVGLEGNKHPKVIGKCVYYASKLSGGRNQIFSDKELRRSWPSTKDGSLSFSSKKVRGIDGFLLQLRGHHTK